MIRRYGEPVVAGQIYRRRPGVYAILLRGDDILLTHQAEPDNEFQLPGGGIDPGEHPLPALHREVMEETGWRIAIFLSVLDVHVNRSPFAGTIGHQIYVKGKFVNASLDKAHHENERMVQRLDTGDKRAPHIGIVQIAGLVARRILCDVRVDDKLGAGQLFGIIRFGSRVDVWVPEEIAPLVLVGQKTIAGETVLADLSGKRSGPR